MQSRVADALSWLEDLAAKQAAAPLHEDPLLRAADVASKLQRTADLVKRLADTPKPKDKKPPAKGKNFKFENVTFNSNDGDGEELNLEDFIKIEVPEGSDDQASSNGGSEEQQEPNEEESSGKKKVEDL
jgi:hypothetical protein